MLKFLPIICVNQKSMKYICRVQMSQGREQRCLHSPYITCRTNEGATCPAYSWMEGITLSLLQSMETEEEQGRWWRGKTPSLPTQKAQSRRNPRSKATGVPMNSSSLTRDTILSEFWNTPHDHVRGKIALENWLLKAGQPYDHRRIDSEEYTEFKVPHRWYEFIIICFKYRGSPISINQTTK